VCAEPERLLAGPGFKSQVGPIMYARIRIISVYALRLISWTGKRV